MTIKITGRASSNDDNANTSVARELVQRLGERFAHLLVEMDAPCAAQCNHRNSIGYFCRQNISVHRVLLLFLMSLCTGAIAAKPSRSSTGSHDSPAAEPRPRLLAPGLRSLPLS